MARKTNSVVGMKDHDWQAEDDLHTFMRYCEVKKDPKRMAKVKELAKKKLTDIASVVGETNSTEG